MKRTIMAISARIALTAARVIAAACLCMLGLWAYMVFAPDCRFDRFEWTRDGHRVPASEVCARDLALRETRRDGRDCLELYALKDGLPIGEHCPVPGAR
ncbi:hypothetical protein ABIE09_003456 [Lysobacter enzymogenes]|uniref:hypothetical protein n=1 Tax=Lysobacter enzymogenes TaxID=69 RepID=UPI0033979EE0